MKITFITAAIAAASIFILASCSDTTGGIGSSLVDDETEVVVESDFKVTGRSTESNVPIQSRTITQLLGEIDAEGYGVFSSQFVTQFMPASTIVTEGVLPEYIDSLQLLLTIPRSGGCIGDSILPMGLNVYRLDRQLPQPIYSDFDPADYYNPQSGLLGSKIYTFNTIEQNDSVKKLAYRSVTVDLPVELGREFFTLYRDNPSAFSTPMEFAKHFPGIAVMNSFGAGRVVEITSTTMRMYYHTMGTDSLGKPIEIPHVGTYFAVTPEIVSNNCINYQISPKLQARIDAGENIIVAPAGRDVELDFPISDVIEYYYKNCGSLSVVNTLTFKIPAEVIENDYGIGAPQQLLLVRTSDKSNFFLNNDIPDNVSSFYAEYDSKNRCYTFSGLRPYLLDMIDRYGRNGAIPEEEFKFTLVPVTVETETVQNYGSTQTYVSSVTPYVQKPVMVKLDIPKSTVTLTFSKQTVK